MSRGIYLLANDRVSEHASALVASIRALDRVTPIRLIPFDAAYSEVMAALSPWGGVELFDDLPAVEWVSAEVERAFGATFCRRPQNFRKLAAFLGEWEEFLYIDTDIVLFERPAVWLDELSRHSFVCDDFQHRNGLRDVFTSRIRTTLDSARLQHTFNAGFWAARRDLFDALHLREWLAEAAELRDCFPFQSASDQPVLNYLVLKHGNPPHNLSKRSPREPGSWAGSNGFIQSENRVVDPRSASPLRYLHWAGVPLKEGGPYWEIWRRYREMARAARMLE